MESLKMESNDSEARPGILGNLTKRWMAGYIAFLSIAVVIYELSESVLALGVPQPLQLSSLVLIMTFGANAILFGFAAYRAPSSPSSIEG